MQQDFNFEIELNLEKIVRSFDCRVVYFNTVHVLMGDVPKTYLIKVKAYTILKRCGLLF